MEQAPIYVGYGIAFLMAFLSMMIELSNTYGSYFQFTAKSYYSYLYCGAYGVVGFIGFWLYQTGMSTVDTPENTIENPFLRIILIAMVIGWSAKGLLDTPILPGKATDEDEQGGFRLRILINFLFLNANKRFNNIIASKQKTYFAKSINTFVTANPRNGDPKKEFEKRVFDFLAVHPDYGDGGPTAVAQFNAFLSQFAKENDIESSFRFAYRNLGYSLFKAILK